MARRGYETLRHGPMRPIGLGLGNNGKLWYAVIQLRAENKQKTLFNMVGFQTRLKWGTQKEIFTMVPALRNARFARLGCMHRNTFIESPKFLDATLRLRPDLPCAQGIPPTWFAGQITGSEGYTEAVATGWYAAWNMAQTILHGHSDPLPNESCIASLMNRLVEENEDFQPMNFNFGLLGLRKGKFKGHFHDLFYYICRTRGVAQPGRASALGAECHQFESGYPDIKRGPLRVSFYILGPDRTDEISSTKTPLSKATFYNLATPIHKRHPAGGILFIYPP